MFQLLRKGSLVHHVASNSIVLLVFALGYAHVGQMDLPVSQIFGSVNCRTEPDVGFLEEPDSERFEIGPEYPLPDVKFLFSYYQGPVDVFLDNPRNLHPDYILENLLQIVEGFDSPTS